MGRHSSAAALAPLAAGHEAAAAAANACESSPGKTTPSRPNDRNTQPKRGRTPLVAIPRVPTSPPPPAGGAIFGLFTERLQPNRAQNQLLAMLAAVDCTKLSPEDIQQLQTHLPRDTLELIITKLAEIEGGHLQPPATRNAAHHLILQIQAALVRIATFSDALPRPR